MVRRGLIYLISVSLLVISTSVDARAYEEIYNTFPTPSNESATLEPTVEINCNEYYDSEIANSNGTVYIIPLLNDTSLTCRSVLKLFDAPENTFIRLIFEEGDSDVKIRYNNKLLGYREVMVPSEAPFQVLVFSDKFTLIWKYLNTSEPLSFSYEPLPREYKNHLIFEDQSKVVSMFDLGGYRPNTIKSFFIVGDKNKEDHSLSLVLNKLKMDEEAGDYLAIGIGRDSTQPSSSTMMFSSSITKPVKVMVIAKDVFVSMSTIFSSGFDFELSYVMSGRNIIKPTPVPEQTTTRSSAQLQALSLCFYEVQLQDWTCSKFMSDEYLKPFKRHVADLAQAYADGDQHIDLPTSGGIRADQVQVECFFKNKSQIVEENFITVVITNPLDKDKAIFNHEQLKDFFKISNYDLFQMLDSKYRVMQCENKPNYWYWYWGSIAIFIFCVLLLMIMWYWSNQIMRRENNRKIKPNSLQYGDEESRVNPAYEETEDFNEIQSGNFVQAPDDQMNDDDMSQNVDKYPVVLRNKNRIVDREDSMLSSVSDREGYQSQILYSTQNVEKSNLIPLVRKSSIQNESLPKTPVEKNEISLNEMEPEAEYAEITQIRVVKATKPRGLSEISNEATNL